MLDRQKLETILVRRFPGATREQVAVSANAIMGLGDEWQEMECHDFQTLAAQFADGAELRVLRRRSDPDAVDQCFQRSCHACVRNHD
jgi:hypothetical protein